MLVVAVLGLTGLFGMKILPLYIEFYALEKVLTEFVDEPDLKVMSPKQIRLRLIQRLVVDGYDTRISENKGENLKIQKKDGRLQMILDYDAKTPFFSNIFIVAHFQAEFEAKN